MVPIIPTRGIVDTINSMVFTMAWFAQEGGWDTSETG